VLASFLVGVEICFQKIGEKEDFQDNKHDKQFYKNDKPHLAAPVAHVFKAADVKLPNPDYDIILLHGKFCINLIF
jgi:hypothetical protein